MGGGGVTLGEDGVFIFLYHICFHVLVCWYLGCVIPCWTLGFGYCYPNTKGDTGIRIHSLSDLILALTSLCCRGVHIPGELFGFDGAMHTNIGVPLSESTFTSVDVALKRDHYIV